MVVTRPDQQPENLFTGAIADMQTALNELKTGVQYVEPKLYDVSTSNTYDVSGSFSSSGSGNVVAQVIFTAQSVDSTPLLATFTPVIWMDNTTSPYVDMLTTNYGVSQNIQVSDDPTKVSYFVTIYTRSALSSSFWCKIYCWTSSPATLSIARTI